MRDPVRCRDKSIGYEMNFRNCFLFLVATGLLVASPVHAQTRVGEAAVVKNEVLRVAASSTSQIKVGDGLVRRAATGRQHASRRRGIADRVLGGV
jgi:hypothetical protein